MIARVAGGDKSGGAVIKDALGGPGSMGNFFGDKGE